ncbi:MAG: cob(I)yrinic acid a,c-diamide adenosyltransferase [Candidatus Anstonellales archaeon]
MAERNPGLICMAVYTREGDKGESSVGGPKLPKHDLIFEVLGTIDELNASMGIAAYNSSEVSKKILSRIQSRLFDISACMIGKKKEKFDGDVKEMERIIDEIEAKLPTPKSFVVPSGNVSYIDFARTVCRRAERRVVLFSRVNKIEPSIITFFNRLSDLLFILARYEEETTRNRAPF